MDQKNLNVTLVLRMEKWRKQGFYVEYREKGSEERPVPTIIVKHVAKNKNFSFNVQCNAKDSKALNETIQFYMACLSNYLVTETVNEKKEDGSFSDKTINNVIMAHSN